MKIKIIWFDFGGVLSPPITELYRHYYLKTGIKPASLQKAMNEIAKEMNMDGLAPLEKGILSERDWGRKIRYKLLELFPGIDLSRADLEHFGKQWFKDVLPNQKMISFFNSVKQSKLMAGILTNNVIEWEPHWKKIIEVSSKADFIIDSCKIGYRKPEKEIFHIAVDKAGVLPSECLLIDDLMVNCIAAEQNGWNAIQYIRTENVINKIELLLKSQGGIL
ncbi:HAD-IA family hydrolase [Pantoea piersonii]|uniref:HAD family hydrolase n=1 Tax=Pantoea piersonii TaxID=2364647 RepID=UPI002FD9589D